MNDRSQALYRTLSMGMAAVFALVGGVFLIQPGQVIAFFNTLSRHLGMIEAPLTGRSFYVALAVAYMYVVTLLAWRMFKAPRERTFPLLLAHAKFASSLLSFGMFFFHAPWLISLMNGIVDACLGVLALWMFSLVRALDQGRKA